MKPDPIPVPTTRGALFRGFLLLGLILTFATSEVRATEAILQPDDYRHYIESFNAAEQDEIKTYIYNHKAWAWLRGMIPLLDCPDEDLQRTYYFRWWTVRKHIAKPRPSFVVTEFLPPVSWAGPHNTIVCAVGHHLNELRWFHQQSYLDDYLNFWFHGGGEVHRYSSWLVHAAWQRALVTGDTDSLVALLPEFVRFYEDAEMRQFDEATGLFWSVDSNEGMEFSISGVTEHVRQHSHTHREAYRGGQAVPGYRVATNAYMVANARAIAEVAALAGETGLVERFTAKSHSLQERMLAVLWDENAGFFKSTVSRGTGPTLSDARELSGLIPWYFDLTATRHDEAWTQIMDPEGFHTPYGPTTVEQRHPDFMYANGHMCSWNGPVWPFATTQTLVGMANLLNRSGDSGVVDRDDYLQLLRSYAATHRIEENGEVIPFIGESIDPANGEWRSRRILLQSDRADKERGRHYNHSGFVDLVVTGLAGLRPRADDMLEVNPLFPTDTWDYFCLDNIRYRDRTVSLVFDRTGERYGRGKGFMVFADGQLLAQRDEPGRVEVPLPPRELYHETVAGWTKHEGNPVLGGDLGTCFDVSVLRDGGPFKMWFSWRPQKSIALTESEDGKHWSSPEIAVPFNRESRWEDLVNRPVVIRRGDEYLMWYTGQTRTPQQSSKIGFARSLDGENWNKVSPDPVLVADDPWEKVALMCPHVIWDEEAGLFKMWYSGGEQYEPDAIGYATSRDGIKWDKHPNNPIFAPDRNYAWEYEKVTACQVVKHDGWYYMFYIGFHDVHWAQIGVARSLDGISDWERHPQNPLIRTSQKGWDRDACYKPFVIYDEDNERWMLWYNGRKLSVEQIGLAIHEGEDLGF